jgi:hypothetical protein
MPAGIVARIGFFVLAATALGVPSVPAPAGGPTPFTEEALARGIFFMMSPFPQNQGYLGQGGGFADLDSDGDPDVVLIGDVSGRVGIYENIGGGIFVDRSLGTGIPIMTEQEGFAAADYDADGLLDLYLTQHFEPNILMKNLGDFTFDDVTSAAGVGDPGPGTGPAWGDYDNDGWLDLYVSNYSFTGSPTPLNLLYHNNGNGTFNDVAPAQGVDSDGLSFQSVWTDYDKDGDVDLYLSNDRGPIGYTPNQLWRNDNGTLVDVSAASNADVSLFSMGLAAGDFDGNLYPDFYTTNLYGEPPPLDGHPDEGVNPLLLNMGDGTFVEAAEAAGVASYITSWAAIFFDYDNNGHKDLYVNNMWVPNSFFTNDGIFPCVEIAADVGVEASYDPNHDPQGGSPASIVSFTSAVADVDGDGDLDLLVNNIGSRAELFINNEGSTRNYVRYHVVGEHPNLFAVGVNIETTAGGNVYWDESYAGGNGYLGQNELVLHVGLDDIPIVDQAIVNWPSGGPTRTLTDLPVNEQWTIYPPSRLCDFDGGGVNYDDFVEFSACFLAGFSPGCEMMDFDGDSNIHTDDMGDCFVDNPSDCNANGTEDLAEILLDATLDADQDYLIDCCQSGTPDDPKPVGNTLTLNKINNISILNWANPGQDETHAAPTSYDIFSTNALPGEFGLLANETLTFHIDDVTTDDRYYLVGARNACGSSGEEPF